MTKWIYWILVVHSPIIVYVLWSDLTTPGEDWSWSLAFFTDFPLSIAFYGFFGLVEEHVFRNRISDPHSAIVTLQFLTHLIVGGTWWLALVTLIRRLIYLLGHRSHVAIGTDGK
jgi:hypothetical protein